MRAKWAAEKEIYQFFKSNKMTNNADASAIFEQNYVLELEAFTKQTMMQDVKTIAPRYEVLVHNNANVYYEVNVFVGWFQMGAGCADKDKAQQIAAQMMLGFLKYRESKYNKL